MNTSHESGDLSKTGSKTELRLPIRNMRTIVTKKNIAQYVLLTAKMIAILLSYQIVDIDILWEITVLFEWINLLIWKDIKAN